VTDDVGTWLRGLGLGEYEAAFRRNRVDAALLPSLTTEDLKDLGMAAVGDRRRILDAVAAPRAGGLLAEVSGLPEPALRGTLDALAAADLVRRRGTPPDAVYAFKHALVRDAAYGTLLRERRRELHCRAAEAIETLRPEAAGREPEVLAHHLAEACEAETAAGCYLRAAERAAGRPPSARRACTSAAAWTCCRAWRTSARRGGWRRGSGPRSARWPCPRRGTISVSIPQSPPATASNPPG
jgi:hypothetical protein